ncbi:hypothetical protein CCACVL1_00517 [Corchorus capsularis]|uniref:Uncharacterized protein n=1 Tax=Corchorus capsularis TaxID=210143 RepID=A0A1R3KWH1_COCAP|nr:hypothetical protein CCACVL1_00517 [Corchorus capsularis]
MAVKDREAESEEGKGQGSPVVPPLLSTRRDSGSTAPSIKGSHSHRRWRGLGGS